MIDLKILASALATLAVALLTSCTPTAMAPTPKETSASVDVSAHTRRHEIDRGARLYSVSCAGCHGANARGTGPVSPLIGATVPDLTRIAARRGGAFPVDDLYRIIDGQADLSAHGARHMPVWGYEFFGSDPDDEVAHREAARKIDQLVAFLRSIQRPE